MRGYGFEPSVDCAVSYGRFEFSLIDLAVPFLQLGMREQSRGAATLSVDQLKRMRQALRPYGLKLLEPE